MENDFMWWVFVAFLTNGFEFTRFQAYQMQGSKLPPRKWTLLACLSPLVFNILGSAFMVDRAVFEPTTPKLCVHTLNHYTMAQLDGFVPSFGCSDPRVLGLAWSN